MKVRKRTYPSGKIAWEFWLTKNETGTSMIRKGGFKTRREATFAASTLLSHIKLHRGDIDFNPDKTTFDELYEVFMHQARLSDGEGTVSNYEGLYKNHFQNLYGKTIAELNPFFLDCWKKNIKSVYVRNNCVKLINATFNYCAKKHIIPFGIYEPLKKDKEPKVHRNRIPIAQLSLIFKTCKRYLPDFYSIFVLATFTGMRVGEYSSIRLKDIDYEHKVINIRQQFTKRKLKKNTKTIESKRSVDVPTFVLQVLREYIISNEIESGLIFKAIRPHKKTLEKNNSQEIPISYNWVRDRFKKLLELSEKETNYMRVHDLRGEYVDIARVSGMTMAYIAKQVGHARKSTTENMYSEIFNDEGEQAKEKMQELFSSVVIH